MLKILPFQRGKMREKMGKEMGKEILKKGCKADHTTHAKELKKDLIVDAMREVTNMSSRMAIDSHRKRFSGCNEYSLNSNIGSQNPRSATTSEKSRRWY